MLTNSVMLSTSVLCRLQVNSGNLGPAVVASSLAVNSVHVDALQNQTVSASKIVNNTITVNNTSSLDSPGLTCTLTDALLGIAKPFALAPGASDITNTSRPVVAGDPDPLVNTASVSCTVDDVGDLKFGNVLEDSDDHSVNLFQPSLSIDKTGDDLSKVGDIVNNTITQEWNCPACV